MVEQRCTLISKLKNKFNYFFFFFDKMSDKMLPLVYLNLIFKGKTMYSSSLFVNPSALVLIDKFGYNFLKVFGQIPKQNVSTVQPWLFDW